MADVDVAAATEEWDDFADASNPPDDTARKGAATGDLGGTDTLQSTPAAVADELVGPAFGSAAVDSAREIAFGDFDGPSPANEEFGDFSNEPATSARVEQTFGDFDSPTVPQDDAFGAFNGPSVPVATDNVGGVDATPDEDFGDFDGPSAPPAGDKFGDLDETAAEDFGDFDSPPAPVAQDDFADLDAPGGAEDFGGFNTSAAPTSGENFADLDPPIGSDDFGDFDGPAAPAAGGSPADADAPGAAENFGDFDAAAAPAGGEDFGSFDAAPATVDNFGAFDAIAAPSAPSDDFGDFDGPSAAPVSTGANGDGMDPVLASDDFGDFDGPSSSAAQEVNGFSPAQEDFGDFDGPSTNDDFGDFDGPAVAPEPSAADEAFGAFDDASAPAEGFGAFGDASTDDVFAGLAAGAQAPPSTVEKHVVTQLSDEEVGARLLEKRWYADSAAWAAASRRRRELAEAKEAMDAAAKALRFEEAIMLRSKIADLEEQCATDEAASESRRRRAADESRTPVDLSEAFRTIRALDPTAASRLESSVNKRLDGRDALSDLEALDAAAVQRFALETAAISIYARRDLSGAESSPPVAWTAVVEKASELALTSSPALREIMAVYDADELDRNRAKKLADHVLALRTAVAVGCWVVEAADRAGFASPPGGPEAVETLSSAASELDSLLESILPESKLDWESSLTTSAVDDYELPETIDQLSQLPRKMCALTFRRLDDDNFLRYEGKPFLAPVINFWLNLVSTRLPADFRET